MDIPSNIFERRKNLAIYWYNKSSDLRGAAGALWVSMDVANSKEIVEKLGLGKGFSMKVATAPVYGMLCGMSLELLYKAIVVAKGAEPNTNSHKLTDLAKEAGVSVTEQQEGLLEVLSEYIIWNGRYPVPKKQEYMQHLNELVTEHLYDREPFGKTYLLRPNGALNWESFNILWGEGYDVYCENCS